MLDLAVEFNTLLTHVIRIRALAGWLPIRRPVSGFVRRLALRLTIISRSDFEDKLRVHEPNDGVPRSLQRATNKRTKKRKKMYMRKTILGAASAIALASPAAAADLPVPAPYSQSPGYQSYEYRTAPPVVVEEPAPPVVIERRVVIAPPPVVVEQYPVYPAPRAYAYAGPIWGHGRGWGYRHHFHGGW